MTNELDIFVRQVRNRSVEYSRAFELVYDAQLYGQCISILRQELDSMVRVIYLLAQPINRRNELIESSVCGEKWTQINSRRRITDREMVDLAQILHGWTQSVYSFGCAFVHLSNLHHYNDRDSYLALPEKERTVILGHCRYYHHEPMAEEPSFQDFLPILPRILEKVSCNLEGYLRSLERQERKPIMDI